MSIVNDALRKAGKEKEFESRDQDMPITVQKTKPASDKKWAAIITASFVIIASFFGSWVLYKNLTVFNSADASNASSKPASAIQSTLNNIEHSSAARAMKSQDVAKLNGIVYGDGNKWAIVDNRIVKEGDKLLGGEITSITKDVVKIGKKDGSEVTLSLK